MQTTVHISATIKTAVRDGVLKIAKEKEWSFSKAIDKLLEQAVLSNQASKTK